MVGYDRPDLYSGGIRWTDMTPPEWAEADRTLKEQLQRKGSAGPIEKEYYRKDGSRVLVLVGLAMLASTGEAAILALDLTERRRVEANLRASEERFRTAFATSAIGLAIAGLDGRFIEVNDTACSIAGYSRTNC